MLVDKWEMESLNNVLNVVKEKWNLKRRKLVREYMFLTKGGNMSRN